uniref:Aspartyl beta-hydroxylase/Triadin domain-containing protein n=1 Tax=Cyanistes caeruleus TaxID=156563 RepID=A0A8C0UTG6_CYACU
MADDTETKHGGGKNGKKEGLSGSSFFTWFMVIALLGVWTSVAVVWFELVDYEEVLAKAKDFRYNLSEVLQGKLGIYDADGDGDFDVEDAKVLLGLKERSVPAQPTSPESEESVQPAENVESVHKMADIEVEEEIQSVLHEALHSQPGERHEDVDENVNDQWQVKEEIHDETLEVPATDDMLRELENEIPEAYETPDSVQKDADSMVDDVGAVESESYEIPALDDYVPDLEERISDPDTPGDSEVMPEDAVEHYAEDRVHEDYSEDQGMTTAIFSEITVSKSFVNMQVELLCFKISYAAILLCKFSAKVLACCLFKLPVFVISQSINLLTLIPV